MVRKALVLGVLLAGLFGALTAVLPSEAAPAAVGETITLSITEVGTGSADVAVDAGPVTTRVTAAGTETMAAIQFVVLYDDSVLANRGHGAALISEAGPGVSQAGRVLQLTTVGEYVKYRATSPLRTPVELDRRAWERNVT